MVTLHRAIEQLHRELVVNCTMIESMLSDAVRSLSGSVSVLGDIQELPPLVCQRACSEALSIGLHSPGCVQAIYGHERADYKIVDDEEDSSRLQSLSEDFLAGKDVRDTTPSDAKTYPRKLWLRMPYSMLALSLNQR